MNNFEDGSRLDLTRLVSLASFHFVIHNISYPATHTTADPLRSTSHSTLHTLGQHIPQSLLPATTVHCRTLHLVTSPFAT